MPNAHAADKEMLGLYMPRTLAMRVRKAAKARKIPLTQFINEALTHATDHIELSPEDYEEIAATIRAAQSPSAKRAKGKARQASSKKRSEPA